MLNALTQSFQLSNRITRWKITLSAHVNFSQKAIGMSLHGRAIIWFIHKFIPPFLSHFAFEQRRHGGLIAVLSYRPITQTTRDHVGNHYDFWITANARVNVHVYLCLPLSNSVRCFNAIETSQPLWLTAGQLQTICAYRIRFDNAYACDAGGRFGSAFSCVRSVNKDQLNSGDDAYALHRWHQHRSDAFLCSGCAFEHTNTHSLTHKNVDWRAENVTDHTLYLADNRSISGAHHLRNWAKSTCAPARMPRHTNEPLDCNRCAAIDVRSLRLVRASIFALERWIFQESATD